MNATASIAHYRRFRVFGKHFASTYTGSLIGAGSPVFAIWGYVIANMKPDKDVGCQVELNPKLLAFVIGDTEAAMEGAIRFLCRPDDDSRSQNDEGRRLIKIGQFDYRVVNGPKYLDIRSEEERREKNRIRQQEHRQKTKPKKKGPTPNEVKYVKASENGAPTEVLDRIAADGVPEI